jgi:L-histidine Nalpha-methyltransferase / hercynylcysteine S-oxide synthase
MSPRIFDVRLNDNASNGETNLHDEIVKGLSRPFDQKTLPTVLLYDAKGLRIYDEITTDAKEYYLFPAEENLFKGHAHDIVKVMNNQNERDNQHVESVVLELGAGCVLTPVSRPTSIPCVHSLRAHRYDDMSPSTSLSPC